METFGAAIKCMRLGAFDYLLNTCELDELLAKLEEASREKHLQHQKIFASGAKVLGQKWRQDEGLG
jgi:DNA-binding NtrC family response regulator